MYILCISGASFGVGGGGRLPPPQEKYGPTKEFPAPNLPIQTLFYDEKWPNLAQMMSFPMKNNKENIFFLPAARTSEY